MDAHPERFIAVDWSGSASPAAQRKHIVAADCHAGRITLTHNRTRAETITWLIEQAALTPSLVVGLDFAFSYPAWFVQQQGAAAIEDFWRIVAAHGETWLATCSDPFWGRPATRCPSNHRAPDWLGYRGAERLGDRGRQPSSPFQIGGAGAVGTGSLRGIPWLLTLREAGFAVWPFHASAFPMVMEIYPRTFTGPVHKSSREAREAYVQINLAKEELSAAALEMAIGSEDAFDALCSAIGMARQHEAFSQLRQTTGKVTLLEGAIFPGVPLAHQQ